MPSEEAQEQRQEGHTDTQTSQVQGPSATGGAGASESSIRRCQCIV